MKNFRFNRPIVNNMTLRSQRTGARGSRLSQVSLSAIIVLADPLEAQLDDNSIVSVPNRAARVRSNCSWAPELARILETATDSLQGTIASQSRGQPRSCVTTLKSHMSAHSNRRAVRCPL